MSLLQEESFSKAEELLHVLWRHDTRWQPFPRHWVFRGQGSSEWELQPSAFRAGLEVYYGPSTPFRPCEKHGDQVRAEAMIVQAFLTELDRQGIPPPTESAHRWHDIFHMFGDLMEHGEGDPWPPEELLPLFGLAQHHGIPTRLLDWSERPLVAAYFAALDASIRIETGRAGAGDQLAVWAFDYQEADSLFTLLEEEERYPRFEIVRPPRATNPNLLAQGGVFSVVVDKRRYEDPAVLPNLEGLLARRAAERGDEFGERTVMRKLTLPVDAAGKLMRLLDDDHVSATYLFPGVYGVARGLLEKRYWDVVKVPSGAAF